MCWDRSVLDMGSRLRIDHRPPTALILAWMMQFLLLLKIARWTLLQIDLLFFLPLLLLLLLE